MIKKAKLAGVDIIKFQNYLLDEKMLLDTTIPDNFDKLLYEFKRNVQELSGFTNGMCKIELSL